MTRLRSALAFLLLAFCVASCSRDKGDPTEAAKKFFAQIAAGQTSQAYAEAAFGFQAQQSERAFAQNVNELGLAHQEALQWDPPEIAGEEATIGVEVSGKDGRKLRFNVTLVYESTAWRVHSLRVPKGFSGTRSENRFTLVGKGASFTDALSQPLPEEAALREMCIETILRFDEALQKKSFQQFYDSVAEAWQKQLTVSQLERAFRPFIESSVRIGGLDQAELRFDGPPAINSSGILVINGHFQTAPYQVFFSMKFVYELPKWKLFGLDVNLQQ